MKYFTQPPTGFKEIPGIPRYYIGRCGVVWGPRGRMSPHVDRDGYIRVTIRGHNCPPVHRLLALTFLPAPVGPGDWTVDHINSIRTDNRLENLRWQSREDNGRRAQVRIAGRVLSDEAVAEIRRRAAAGDTYARIAEDFGRGEATIWKIAHGQRYRTVAGPLAAARYNRDA